MSGDADLNWIFPGEFWRYTVTTHSERATYAAAMKVGMAQAPADPTQPIATMTVVPGACSASKPLDCKVRAVSCADTH